MATQQESQSVEPYIDEREVAKRVGLAVVTLQSWRLKGTGPTYYKVGRRVVYKWTEVEGWIAAGARGGGR